MPPKKRPPGGASGYKPKPLKKRINKQVKNSKKPVKKKPKKPVKATKPKNEIQVHYPPGKEYLYPKSHSKYKPKKN